MRESRRIGLNTVKYVQAECLPYPQSFFHSIICIAMLLLFFLLSYHSAIARNIDPSQFKVKGDRAVTLVKQKASEGKDVSNILLEMQKVKSLGDAGKLDQADALLDKILSRLEAEETGSPAKIKSSLLAASVPAKNTGSPLAASAAAIAGMSEIKLAGAPDHGIFDPSVASDGAGKLYMSLSGVAATTPGGSFGTAAVRTYLAASSDQGKNWQLSGLINPDIAVTLGKAPTNGRWQSEVSALVFDTQAPKQARWKLVWHQYLNINGDRKFEHGWIAYKEAETPGALATAKAVKLFTAAAYDAVNDTTTGWTRSPIAGAGVNKVQQLSPALAGCIAVSEPGLLSKPDALYMSQVCFKSSSAGITNDVVLLKCARPCNAAAPGAWSYAGTALTPADSQALSLGKFSASDLFSDNGKDYIAVSPEGTTPVADAYKGCNVFRFADIASGKVERVASGRPSPATAVSMSADSFNGACTFLPTGANKGLLIGRIDFVKITNGVDATFHIFRSNVSP
jgi:hypothetical protein